MALRADAGSSNTIAGHDRRAMSGALRIILAPLSAGTLRQTGKAFSAAAGSMFCVRCPADRMTGGRIDIRPAV